MCYSLGLLSWDPGNRLITICQGGYSDAYGENVYLTQKACVYNSGEVLYACVAIRDSEVDILQFSSQLTTEYHNHGNNNSLCNVSISSLYVCESQISQLSVEPAHDDRLGVALPVTIYLTQPAPFCCPNDCFT